MSSCPVARYKNGSYFIELETNSLLNSAIFDPSRPQVQYPIVQCVQIKTLPPQPGQPERYRAVFSDISNYVQTMLATRKYMASTTC